MSAERDKINEETGYPGSGCAEELESDQVERQHEDHAGEDRGDLSGPLPVSRPVSPDQPMNCDDGHRVNRVIDRMEEAFGKRSLRRLFWPGRYSEARLYRKSRCVP